MLKAYKQRLLRATKRVGFLDSVADSEWRRQRLLILCYHSVSMDQEHQWRRPLFFTVQEFEQRLQLLQRRGINVLSLGEAINRLRAGTLPPRSAVLTFDDGCVDFGQIVWPMLKRCGYPATVYVTTYYSEKRQPVFPLMCSYLLWKSRSRVMQPAPELGILEATSLSSVSQRAIVERSIIDQAEHEGLNADEKNQRAARLAELLAIDYGDLLQRRLLQVMTPEEIGQVAADGADVQLHTHRHRAPRRQDLFKQEIADNRMRLEALTGRRAQHFCYPSGVYRPEFLPWLKEQRILTATTCIPGLATATTSVLLLPRVVDTASLAPIEFEGWLCGASYMMPRRWMSS